MFGFKLSSHRSLLIGSKHVKMLHNAIIILNFQSEQLLCQCTIPECKMELLTKHLVRG